MSLVRKIGPLYPEETRFRKIAKSGIASIRARVGRIWSLPLKKVGKTS
ncbi:hypothetical protein B0O79_3540 [Flavobacteriaceae bacterium MAR_2009_75]|nr:hypothetical protein B0O79_3540 [Flavobacteriaceae bacterium MAR_2009_75]